LFEAREVRRHRSGWRWVPPRSRNESEWRTNLSRRQSSAVRSPAKKRAATARTAELTETLLSRILKSLDDDKAEDIVTIDLEGRSSLADAIVIACGRSARHVSSIAEHLARRLKEAGYGTRPVDGLTQGDWVLVDAGDIIVHVFRPEVREYYDLEGMWSVDEPNRAVAR
jgi:ribosome-associated protein